MTNLVHLTHLDRAVSIMKEGFRPIGKGLDFEQGANFHLAGNINGENQTSDECQLMFTWNGADAVAPVENPKPNVLYDFSPWRYFIKDCDNDFLVFSGFIIKEDAYLGYDVGKIELIKNRFSRKTACDAYFARRIGKRFSVKSTFK